MSKTIEMTADEIIERYRMHNGDAQFLRELAQEVETLKKNAVPNAPAGFHHELVADGAAQVPEGIHIRKWNRMTKALEQIADTIPAEGNTLAWRLVWAAHEALNPGDAESEKIKA